MYKFVLLSFFITFSLSYSFAQYRVFTSQEIDAKVAVLNRVSDNFIVKASDAELNNTMSPKGYSFEWFENKLSEHPELYGYYDVGLLYGFFNTLCLHYNNKLSELFNYISYFRVKNTELLKDFDCPESFLLLPAVLTGFDERFSSPEGCGVWRLKYHVALRFGLEMNEVSDQRFVNSIATRAAYKYFRSLNEDFDDTDMALLAFMSSPVLIKNLIALKNENQTIFNSLPDDLYLDMHFLKALLFLFENRNSMGFRPLNFNYTRITDSVLIPQRFLFDPVMRLSAISAREFFYYNPSFKNNFSDTATVIILPEENAVLLNKYLQDSILLRDSINFSQWHFLDKMELPRDSLSKIHVVRSGETLSAIASRYPGVTVNDIVRLNHLKSPDKISEGQELIIAIP